MASRAVMPCRFWFRIAIGDLKFRMLHSRDIHHAYATPAKLTPFELGSGIKGDPAVAGDLLAVVADGHGDAHGRGGAVGNRAGQQIWIDRLHLDGLRPVGQGGYADAPRIDWRRIGLAVEVVDI